MENIISFAMLNPDDIAKWLELFNNYPPYLVASFVLNILAGLGIFKFYKKYQNTIGSESELNAQIESKDKEIIKQLEQIKELRSDNFVLNRRIQPVSIETGQIPDISPGNLNNHLQVFYKIQSAKGRIEIEVGKRIVNLYSVILERLSGNRNEFRWTLKWHILNAFRNLETNDAIDAIIEKGLRFQCPIIQAHSANLIGQMHELVNKYEKKSKIIEELQSLYKSTEISTIKNESLWALNRIKKQKNNFNGFTENGVLAYVFIKTEMILEIGENFNHDEPVENFAEQIQFGKTGVLEAARIVGDYDIIIVIFAENLGSLTAILMREIQKYAQVQSTRTFIAVDEPFRYQWFRDYPNKKNMPIRITPGISYVLIRANAPTSTDAIVTCLLDCEQVISVFAVYGEVDVIAKIVGDESERDRTLIKIRKIPYIKTTDSYSVVKGVSSRETLDYWKNPCELADGKGKIDAI